MASFIFSKNRWKYIRIAMRHKTSPQFVFEIAHNKHLDDVRSDDIIRDLLNEGIIHRRRKDKEK